MLRSFQQRQPTYYLPYLGSGGRQDREERVPKGQPVPAVASNHRKHLAEFVAVGVWQREVAGESTHHGEGLLLLCQNTTKLMAFIAFLNDSAVASALELDGFDSVVD
jgi:hypothetical protein